MNIEELREKIYTKEKELEELKEQLNRVNNYQTVIIINIKTNIKKYDMIKKEINKICGNIKEFEELGIKKLAYEIQKNKEAFYLQFFWEGTSETVSEIERYFRINDNILKYITIKVEEG